MITNAKLHQCRVTRKSAGRYNANWERNDNDLMHKNEPIQSCILLLFQPKILLFCMSTLRILNLEGRFRF